MDKQEKHSTDQTFSCCRHLPGLQTGPVKLDQPLENRQGAFNFKSLAIMRWRKTAAVPAIFSWFRRYCPETLKSFC